MNSGDMIVYQTITQLSLHVGLIANMGHGNNFILVLCCDRINSSEDFSNHRLMELANIHPSEIRSRLNIDKLACL